MLKQFTVKGKSLACWVNPDNFGSHGQSLVFIHGSGSNSTVWSFQYANLHQDFNIVAVDLSVTANRKATENRTSGLMLAYWKRFLTP